MKYVSGNDPDLFAITSAYTIKPIHYKSLKTGKEVNVPINTYIIVDMIEGIALVGPDHIVISADEYKAVQQ